MKVVCVAGNFNPLHRGHLDHFRKAKALGDKLFVITHRDRVLVKKRGYCLLPLVHRVAILKSIRWIDKVLVSIDKDGTVAKTLEMLKGRYENDELIFAKGGDRVPDNMPQGEVDTCERLGIPLVYGIGDKLASSQDLATKVMKQIGGDV